MSLLGDLGFKLIVCWFSQLFGVGIGSDHGLV